MKIFIDRLILQDIIHMIIVLGICNKILERKIDFRKIMILSICCSMFSVCLLLYFPQLYDNMLIKGIVSYLIVRYGFQIKDGKNIFSDTILLLSIFFTLGGIYVFAENDKWIIILLTSSIIIMVIQSIRNKRKARLLETISCTIILKYEGKKYSLNALIDTGNNVKTIWNEN